MTMKLRETENSLCSVYFVLINYYNQCFANDIIYYFNKLRSNYYSIIRSKKC